MFLSQYPEEFERTLYIDKASINCWLHEQTKPTLTEDERVILRNIDKKWKCLYRQKTGELELHSKAFTNSPAICEWLYLEAFTNLFQFIKERRRI